MLPARAAAEGPANVSCEEMFRRTIREELGRGDHVWIIYRDGHTVRGRFMGLVKERPEFLVAPGEGGFEVSEAYPFSEMQTLRYRRLASDGDKILNGARGTGDDEEEAPMIPAADALHRLREGNARFVSGVRSLDTLMSQTRLHEHVAGQEPFAVVLGCSDSRVPVEIVFDQGLGDLFVIRVAGNVVAASQIGSVEFAVEYLRTRLVVVLGHTHCGAIDTTLSELLRPAENQSPNLRSIVDRIRPSVEGLLTTGLKRDRGALARQAVRANVRVAADRLRHGSEILERRIESGELLVVGAEYSIETGDVDFFDGLPPER